MTEKVLEKQLFAKDGTPKCFICGKKMVQAYDNIAKKKTKYYWKYNCNCAPKDLRLCIC